VPQGPSEPKYSLFLKRKLEYFGSATSNDEDPFASRMQAKQNAGLLKRKSYLIHALLFGKTEIILKTEAVGINICLAKTNINLDRPFLSNKRDEIRVLCSMKSEEYMLVAASVVRITQDLYKSFK
jgi:hypothetical protein